MLFHIWKGLLSRGSIISKRPHMFKCIHVITCPLKHNTHMIRFRFFRTKTSIYHIISNFPKNCRRNTRKTDKVYNFLQSAKLTCVGDLWTQALRSISQSPRGNLGSTSLAEVIWYIAGRFSEFKGHPHRSTLRIGGNRRLCPFSVCCGSNFGENCR